jgi:hypothetical protein
MSFKSCKEYEPVSLPSWALTYLGAVFPWGVKSQVLTLAVPFLFPLLPFVFINLSFAFLQSSIHPLTQGAAHLCSASGRHRISPFIRTVSDLTTVTAENL